MRNIDWRLDGNLSVIELKCDRLEPRKKLEIGGDLKLNRLEAVGMKYQNATIGDYGDRCRDFINIELGDNYIWNNGIKIKAHNKLGIDVESEGIAIKTNGIIAAKDIEIYNEEEPTEELNERDISSILDELKVEKTREGKLKLIKNGNVNVLDILLKLVAIISKK